MILTLVALVLGFGFGAPHNAAAAGIHPAPHHAHVAFCPSLSQPTHNLHRVTIHLQVHRPPVVFGP